MGCLSLLLSCSSRRRSAVLLSMAVAGDSAELDRCAGFGVVRRGVLSSDVDEVVLEGSVGVALIVDPAGDGARVSN
jgi:hypothetical protein